MGGLKENIVAQFLKKVFLSMRLGVLSKGLDFLFVFVSSFLTKKETQLNAFKKIIKNGNMKTVHVDYVNHTSKISILFRIQ